MTLLRLMALSLIGTTFACGGSLDEKPPVERPNTMVDAPKDVRFDVDAPKDVALNLKQAKVEEVLEALTTLTEKSLSIEPDAAPLVACAPLVDLNSDGKKVTHRVATRLIAEAVLPAGLLVVEEPTSLTVRKAPGARPCPL